MQCMKCFQKQILDSGQQFSWCVSEMFRTISPACLFPLDRTQRSRIMTIYVSPNLLLRLSQPPLLKELGEKCLTKRSIWTSMVHLPLWISVESYSWSTIVIKLESSGLLFTNCFNWKVKCLFLVEKRSSQ